MHYWFGVFVCFAKEDGGDSGDFSDLLKIP